jgi:hypothetical protein
MPKTPVSHDVTLSASGYFQRDGRPLMPVGVNYWPASCGVAMWAAWPEAEIRHDLDVVKDLGLNCVRFFLRWPDFEPTLGCYNEAMFERLAQLMEWIKERDLLAHPSLVTGFMSGGFFWPADKGSRNLYGDAEVARHAAAFCTKAAAVLAPYRRHILALDLGNELGCADAWPASPAAIRDWCASVTTGIRSAYPGALIVSGTDSGVVINDCGWRLGQQPGTDFYSVHTYPVPNWNVVPFDGMTDPLCQDILPFCTLCARAWGPVMVQEFSSILINGQSQCESYLNAVVPACLANGSNGFLWWCLRDIQANGYPYDKCGFEGRLGLVDAQDRLKPETAALVDMLRALRDEPPLPRPTPEVAIYWPEEYYRRENPANPGNDPSAVFRRMLMAYHFLNKLGYVVTVVRAGEPIPTSVKTLVIAGAALMRPEGETLETWVRGGGRILWSAPSWHAWSPAYDAMIGARPVDIRHPKPVVVHAFGHDWTVKSHPAEGRTAVHVTTAKVIAGSTEGTPEILSNIHGLGKVVAALPLAEETIANLVADRGARDGWIQWYEGLMLETQR